MQWMVVHTMARTIHKTDNVTLEGFQAVLEPSKFGYSLAAVVGSDIIGTLEEERTEVLKWAESKLKTLSVVLSSPNHGKRSAKESIRSSSLGLRIEDRPW